MKITFQIQSWLSKAEFFGSFQNSSQARVSLRVDFKLKTDFASRKRRSQEENVHEGATLAKNCEVCNLKSDVIFSTRRYLHSLLIYSFECVIFLLFDLPSH